MSNYFLNEVSLIGRVGNDPFVSEKGKLSVASFSLATSESWRDKEGALNTETHWHRVVYFGQPAEFVKQHVKKGMLLYVKGKLKNDKWTDKEGNEHFEAQIVSDGRVGFLGEPAVCDSTIDAIS